ncbi:nicotinate (nicotinamide) nucleotide adenylyltransferase [Sediminibacterium sp.]|uniref:nicotinate (nicotinamide) nucleotide adenylyltransferase n=1 Tax=Sediminibacterium sp. TaxID=1917865 RepID=UPI0025DB6065|nr:nicotinate (nicotinamide) nucleotide adenylyltransferase [Sediminibacterium sp.]MBW0176775.1 nicotinate-nucleotide adenylyltransferase [Sediminibacterium sp.]
MNIGLYFGSFNPVHTGHLIIASHVVNQTNIQQVWLVVSPQNPFKTAAGLLNEYDRLHLVNLAIDDETRIRAADVEFKLPRPSYTIDTLTYLREKYPQHQFSIIMGSDGFQNLPKWKNADLLVKEYPIIIYKRPGFDITDTWNASVQILDAPMLDISATLIRNNIREGKSIRYLVPDKVREEIERNNYYK